MCTNLNVSTQKCNNFVKQREVVGIVLPKLTFGNGEWDGFDKAGQKSKGAAAAAK